MERRIDPDAPLDYVELQIFPSHNRYEACVSVSNKAEKVASGDLQQLLSHLPQVKDLSSQSSNSNFKILPPDDVQDWFTTAKLTRFLLIVGSPDILSIGNEISQLEETRKFQLSLFLRAEVDMTSSSYESKNELLQTIDLRLSGLKEKLTDALNQATGATCSPKDISDLENFAHHFGAEEIRDSLQKFVELSQIPSTKDFTTERNVSAYNKLNPPVTYGVSPAKAAQMERQSSSDSETSFSSEDEQPSVERSRTLARSSTPRRSASPMRRIQIGRSGPRRAATLSIKSLNHFPIREKTATQRDVADHSSEEEDESEKSIKLNALRMSVQDKISLFESKKKDQDVDTQKPKTLSTAPVANKAVLRRWSSGMGESAIQCLNDSSNETSSPVSPKDAAPLGNAESCVSQSSAKPAENIKSSSPKNGAAESLSEEINPEHEKHPASIEWNQQKEAELNQLFTKMMESKPVRRQSVTTDNNTKSKSSPKESRGGFYDHYKQKRDEKLRKEAAGKKAEKEAQLKEMHQFLDERKAEMASTNTSDVSRRHSIVNKPKNPQKNPTQLPNSRKEPLKASVVKKATSKPSQLPATRKSWPSTPSTGATTEASPSRTRSSVVSSSVTPTRKPWSGSSAVRTTTKVEKVQPRSKTLKPTQPDAKKPIKTVTEKKQPIAKSAITAKPKVRTQVDTSVAATTTTTTTMAKPSFYNKVTKKSSVVPLETKPFLRKGTGIGPGAGAVGVKKVVAQPEESLCSGDLIQAEKNQVVETTELTGQNREKECEPPEPLAKLDSETHVVSLSLSPTKCEEESESSNQFDVSGDDGLKKIEMSEFNTGTEEESTISPAAWVEVEENHQDEIIQCKETPIQTAGPDPTNLGAATGVSSPRVRHSLFQMLLEETGEADSCEWGNAQQPPAMVYQKDAPKGFKRLLKFARKTKADLTDGSSPSSIFRRG